MKRNNPVLEYLKNCLATPALIALGVALAIYVFFYPQITFVADAAGMMTVQQGDTDEDILREASKPIATPNDEVTTIKYPKYAEKFAEMTIESIGTKDAPIFNCDDYAQMKFGWGRSFYSRYPGEGGKIVMAGHSTKNRNLYDIKVGSEIEIRTEYGRFIYRVTKTKVENPMDTTILKPDDSHEELVMYVCYPLNAVCVNKKRFVVYSELISGPTVTGIPFQDS